MIDTVRYTQQRKFVVPLTWKTINLDKGNSDLRVRTTDGINVEVEVSLPKLLFGTNEKLIRTQKQIEKALAKADKIVDQIAEPTTTPKAFSRVDLVWHFRSRPPEYFFLAHEWCNHPEARTKVFRYRKSHSITGVVWQGGKKPDMQITMYQKSPITVRVEIQLKWHRLRKKLANSGQVERLDLKRCYENYRAVLLKFHPAKIPVVKGKNRAICYAQKRGVPLFDLITPTMANEDVATLRKKLENFLLREYKIDWNKLLPKTFPPPKIEAGIKIIPTKFKFRIKLGKFWFIRRA